MNFRSSDGNFGRQDDYLTCTLYKCLFVREGDQFKVNMGEKKLISNIDIQMYLTLLGNI